MADMDTDKFAAYVRGEFGFALGGHQATLTPGLRAEQRKLTPQNLQNTASPCQRRQGNQGRNRFLPDAVAEPVGGTGARTSTPMRSTRAAPACQAAAERTGTYDSFSYTAAGNGYAVLGNMDLKKKPATPSNWA
jgi:hemoglobin/transferrin/lactoferrin receptor protein